MDEDSEDNDDRVVVVDRSRSASGLMTIPRLPESDGEESEAEQLGTGLGRMRLTVIVSWPPPFHYLDVMRIHHSG